MDSVSVGQSERWCACSWFVGCMAIVLEHARNMDTELSLLNYSNLRLDLSSSLVEHLPALASDKTLCAGMWILLDCFLTLVDAADISFPVDLLHPVPSLLSAGVLAVRSCQMSGSSSGLAAHLVVRSLFVVLYCVFSCYLDEEPGVLLHDLCLRYNSPLYWSYRPVHLVLCVPVRCNNVVSQHIRQCKVLPQRGARR